MLVFVAEWVCESRNMFFSGKFHVIRLTERQRKGAFLSNPDPLHSFESLTGVPYHVSQ